MVEIIPTKKEKKVEIRRPRETGGKELADLVARTRIVEEGLTSIMKKISSIEAGTLRELSSLKDEIKTLKERLGEISKTLALLSDELAIIKERMKDFARKDEVKIIEKYVDLINPSKFVTLERLNRILREKGL